MSIEKIMGAKTNAVGVIAIALISSATTVVLSQWFDGSDATQFTSVPAATHATAGIPECKTGVYSPVQRTCVSQSVFDAEMKRLFAALGLNSSVYDEHTQDNN